MPGGDGTGPFGALVNCRPIDVNENQILTPNQKPFYGRRFFRGGIGRGFRWRYLETGIPGQIAQQQTQQPQPIQTQQSRVESEKPEKNQIKDELNQLEQELEVIKQRIAELKEVAK